MGCTFEIYFAEGATLRWRTSKLFVLPVARQETTRKIYYNYVPRACCPKFATGVNVRFMTMYSHYMNIFHKTEV